MIKATIKEALEMVDEQYEQSIYYYKDGETLLYIGKSDAPFERLRQHMGLDEVYQCGPDGIGQLIIDNQPASLDWLVEIGTVQELIPEQCKQRPNEHKQFTKWLEGRLIAHYKPCMNIMGNRNRAPIPEKYAKRAGIANAGVKITEEEA